MAGSFYPGDADRLRGDVSAMLAAVEPAPPAGRPVILVSPHAGYMYSGHVAAHGYKLLESLKIKTVVVVSPSHMEHFPFVSIFGGAAYETPLGKITVDRDTAEVLASTDPLLQLSDAGHIQDRLPSREHALEVQLPFLQAVLDDFRIVPVVMGDQSWELCRALGDALGPVLKRDDTVAVISSDLSHFYSYETAKELDGVFIDLLRQMDPWRLYESIKQHDCEACGAGPVVSALIAAQHIDRAGCRVLCTANSGDVTGDHDRVVGYTSAVIHEGGGKDAEQAEAEEMLFGREERAFLLDAARYAIEASLGRAERAQPACDSPILDEKRGAFVTLKIRNRLRGCVGTVEPRESVRQITGEMAVAAAANDPRFASLSAEELDELQVEISILSPLRRIASPDEIQVGRHGIVVRKGPRSGLLLPQVGAERGWEAVEFLGHTCEKAGLPANAWRDKTTDIFVFTATVFGEEKELPL